MYNFKNFRLLNEAGGEKKGSLPLTLENLEKCLDGFTVPLDNLEEKLKKIIGKLTSYGIHKRSKMPVIHNMEIFKMYMVSTVNENEYIDLPIQDIIPTQNDIYFDKIIDMFNQPLNNFRKYLESSLFIINNENRIIDGHHRWVCGNIIDEHMTVKCHRIYINIDDFMSHSHNFSKFFGNKRNK